MTTPEGRVKAKVKKAFEKFGRDCWRFMPVQSGYGAPALDFLFSIRGRFVAIETKAPGNELTPQQEATKRDIEAAGGLVFVVWDDETLDAAMATIHLALEFNHERANIHTVAGTAFDGIRKELGRPDLSFRAVCHGTPAADQLDAEYEGAVKSAQAADAAAGGDHGAPGAPPERRAKPKARRHNQTSYRGGN